LAQQKSELQPDRERELRGLARKLGQRFKDLALLDQALRHSSYAHENPTSGESNERLEFLGDAVLSLTVSKLLLEAFPDSPEGDLSRARAALVNARQLAALAGELALGSHLLLGRGEEQQAGRAKPSLLADALEAVLGACFLDGGLKAVEALTQRWFGPLLATSAGLPWQDFKTGLQEHTHAGYNASPTYHLVQESGPGHARHFVVEVRLQDRPLARGEGKTKKQAAQEAARRALELLQAEEA
jgi:ribonuclease III